METENKLNVLNFCSKCGTALAEGSLFCSSCGARLRENTVPEENTRIPIPISDESKFTGGAFANFFIGLLSVIVSFLTLGLAYPAMLCWKMRWKTKHTYINGKKLVFDGKGIQLFGKFILWILLSIITFGIYLIFVMPYNLRKWQTEHTHFEGAEGAIGESYFDGNALGMFGVNLLTFIVTTITAFIGSFWAHCYKERWFSSHEVIDGCRMRFNGTGLQYFGKKIVWLILTVLTLGIYIFWLAVKTEKWTISHKHAWNKSDLPTTYPVEEITESSEEENEGAEQKSRLGLLLSLMSYFAVPIVPAVAGIVLCGLALPKVKAKGTAITGIVLGAVNIVGIAVVLFVFLGLNSGATFSFG